jgi:glycosyltransferase involved in cell wall biosynthesis
MPPFTALLHTANDALRLGRALETLFPCNEILVVDHFSRDSTKRVARRYGVRLLYADKGAASEYAQLAANDWVLCLDSSESLSEALQASLFEWSLLRADDALPSAFNVSAREQIGEIWRPTESVETRLIRRSWTRWNGDRPALDAGAPILEGDLLRITWP